MKQADHLKLLEAGYTIIRRQDTEVISVGKSIFRSMILCKTKENPEWHIMEQDFPSIDEREKRIRELLKSEKIVSD